MATLTRSSRRADGLPRRHHANAHLLATSTRSNQAQNIFPNKPSSRTKRPLDHGDRDYGVLNPKRARISVGLFSKPQIPSPPAGGNTRPVPIPPMPKPIVAPTKPAPRPSQPHQQPQPRKEEPGLTKHREKVINGIKHELDRLQPSATDTRDNRRKLRSQEATRFKSELSAYFPDYDEVIGNDPKEQRTCLSIRLSPRLR